MKEKVIFYIDGLNLWRGFQKSGWNKFYWFNIVGLCNRFIWPHQELKRVNYYTARPLNEFEKQIQSYFLTANECVGGDILNIVYGHHILKDHKCPKDGCKHLYQRPEEKQTDVNLAIGLVTDFLTGECDTSYIISADSDLVPPIRYIRGRKQDHKAIVCFPPGNSSRELAKYATYYHDLSMLHDRMDRHLMPLEVETSKGRKIYIPDIWKKHYPKI